jgi:hypothetical protein
MSTTRSTHDDAGTPAVGTHRPPPQRSAWAGWIRFGAALMWLIGFFQVIEGLAAIFNENFTKTRPNGMVVHVDHAVWGWVHLALGVVIFLSGFGVLTGRLAARLVGVALALIGAVISLAYLPAQPAWGIILVSMYVLLIYALTAHGGEMREQV